MYFIRVILAIVLMIWFAVPRIKLRLCKSFMKEGLKALHRDQYTIIKDVYRQGKRRKKGNRVDVIPSLYGIFVIWHCPVMITGVLQGEESGQLWTLGKSFLNPVLSLQEYLKRLGDAVGNHLPEIDVPIVPILVIYPRVKELQIQRMQDSPIHLIYPKALVPTIEGYQQERLTKFEVDQIVALVKQI